MGHCNTDIRRDMSIFSGNNRTFFVTQEGLLYAWGDSAHGALGIGDFGIVHGTAPRYFPTPVLVGGPEQFDGSPVTMVACGDYHTVAVTKSGAVWSWGDGACGKLGNQSEDGSYVPVRIAVGRAGNARVVMAVCSKIRTILLGIDGSVWVCGRGEGVLKPANWTSPHLMDPCYFFGEKIVMVSVEVNDAEFSLGGDHFFAVGEHGGLFRWGGWDYKIPGQRLHPYARTLQKRHTQLRPIKVDTSKYLPHKIVGINSSVEFTHVILNNGYVCELNERLVWRIGVDIISMAHGRNNAIDYEHRQRQRMLSSGKTHVVSVCVEGNVYAFGKAASGAMGCGDVELSSLPVALDMGFFDGAKIAAVSCGTHHTVALTEEGRIYTWGTMNSSKCSVPTALDFPCIGRFDACASQDILLAFAMSQHVRLGSHSQCAMLAPEPGIFGSVISQFLLGTATCPPWLTIEDYSGICRQLGVHVDCVN